MDGASRDALRAQLESERDRLQAIVAEMERLERETLSEASGENNYRDHMADQGSATFERELDMTLEENARENLLEVQQALERIDAGSYGTCARCGSDIPVERLEAYPTASLCIVCKEAEESPR
jgi:RNA polymerase-binding transcription factor